MAQRLCRMSCIIILISDQLHLSSSHCSYSLFFSFFIPFPSGSLSVLLFSSLAYTLGFSLAFLSLHHPSSPSTTRLFSPPPPLFLPLSTTLPPLSPPSLFPSSPSTTPTLSLLATPLPLPFFSLLHPDSFPFCHPPSLFPLPSLLTPLSTYFHK